MGALAPGSVHARPSAQAPIDTCGNFWTQVSWGGGAKHSKHFLINFLPISNSNSILSTFRVFFDPPVGKGGPPIFVYPKSYFFCDLKPHAKFRNPTINN